MQGENIFSHIYNRGNRKENIFLDDDDFSFFLLRLKQNLYPHIEKPQRMKCFPENSFSLLCYILIPNHFHFIIRQNGDIPVSKLMLKLTTSYSIHFNKKYEKVGHVFQGEFKQKPVENDSYLMWLSAYIHQNPRLHKITNDAESYKWSSYQEYLKPAVPDKICDTGLILGLFENPPSYQKFVEENYNILEQNKNIRKFCHD